MDFLEFTINHEFIFKFQFIISEVLGQDDQE